MSQDKTVKVQKQLHHDKKETARIQQLKDKTQKQPPSNNQKEQK